MRYKRTIGDPDNKAGLAPCDHALAMARAWSREQDRLDDAGDEDASNKAYAEKFRWSDEFDRLFRIRHGIKDISAGVPHESDLDAIWIGTDTSGHSVLWRYHPSLEGNAAHVIAKYFVDRLALAEARVGMQSRSLYGKSVVVFTPARKREVKVGNAYTLEDTGYAETEWRFGAKWSVEVKVEAPLLVDDKPRKKSNGR